MDILEIQLAIRSERIRVSRHANEEAGNDMLAFDEIFNSVLSGEIIEEYPLDYPFPSC